MVRFFFRYNRYWTNRLSHKWIEKGFFSLFNLLVLFLTGCIWDGSCLFCRKVTGAAAVEVYCFQVVIFRTLEKCNRCNRMGLFQKIEFHFASLLAYELTPSQHNPPSFNRLGPFHLLSTRLAVGTTVGETFAYFAIFLLLISVQRSDARALSKVHV